MKVKESLESRLWTILDEFNVPTVKYVGGTYSFLRDSELSCAFRSAILFLAIRARYPHHSEILEICEIIKRGDAKEAVKYVQKKTKRRDRSRLIVPSDSLLVDVTRYSRNLEKSGIPRVIKTLLTSKPLENASFGIWSNQVFGPVDNLDGLIRFPRHIWKTQRQILIFYFIIRRFMNRESTSSPFGQLISRLFIQTRKVIKYRFLIKYLNILSPRACWIIGPKSLLIPEVPDAINSELLRTWIKATGIDNVRVIVHDLLPLSHPKFFPSHAYNEHISYLELLKVSQKLIVGTPILEEVLREFLSMTDKQPQICVVPLPISHHLVGAPPPAIKYSQFTFIGGFQARKGLAELVDFLGKFDISMIDFKVVIVASAHSFDSKENLELLNKVSARLEIYEVKKNVSDFELFELIHTSAAVLYLSRHEGYGLPILESLSFGTPVIAFPSPTNLYFSHLYGGIHFLSDKMNEQSLRELNEIAKIGRVNFELQKSINSRSLPTDKDIWSERILSDGVT